MARPLLSIGIIFKNEIRCLERCLKSLQPLRDALPCELVMADTGSDDGSREVAEKYADILFDFPWVDDFAAARNAVMDRCSGEWHFGIDADEWLDENVAQLVNAIKSPPEGHAFCAVVIRNYSTKDMTGDYSDFLGIRLVQMSTGMRYVGSIHEHFEMEGAPVYGLGLTILHHDGYVTFSKEQREAKKERNMTLLRKELEQDPDNMVTLLQCVESSQGTWEYGGFLSQALKGLEEQRPYWKAVGAPLLRYAVNFAETLRLPEEEERIEQARTLFPNSLFVTIDVAYTAFIKYARDEEYEKAISSGEGYLQALADYHAGRYDASDLTHSTLTLASPARECTMRILLAGIYIERKEFHQAFELLGQVDLTQMSSNDLKNYVGNLINIHAQGGIDMSQTAAELWGRINEDGAKEGYKNALLSAAAEVFVPSYRGAEEINGYRHAYTMFLPLAGKYEIGNAAVVLAAYDTTEMEAALSQVKDWNGFPIHALLHALEYGVQFPLPEKPLNVEEMDALAARLSKDGESMISLACRAVQKGCEGSRQDLTWARSLVMMAARVFSWDAEDVDVEAGMALARAFAQIEKGFLPFCYAPQTLCRENLFTLPPMHRFGWYCAQAFDALDAGDASGYVHLLREGLTACKGVKDMVEFLIDHTPQLQASKPSAELLALADQIRTVLTAYPADDPAVAAIKTSEAYHKVAHLIDKTEPPVTGSMHS